MYTRNCIEGSNPSFTAIFETHKAPDFPGESGASWFLSSEKKAVWDQYGTSAGDLGGGALLGLKTAVIPVSCFSDSCLPSDARRIWPGQKCDRDLRGAELL